MFVYNSKPAPAPFRKYTAVIINGISNLQLEICKQMNDTFVLDSTLSTQSTTQLLLWLYECSRGTDL